MSLHAAYAWGEKTASGPFSAVVQVILGEGADVKCSFDRVPIVSAVSAGPVSQVIGYTFVRVTGGTK